MSSSPAEIDPLKDKAHGFQKYDNAALDFTPTVVCHRLHLPSFITDLDLTMTPISMIIAVQRLSCLSLWIAFGVSLKKVYLYLVNLLSIYFCHVSRI